MLINRILLAFWTAESYFFIPGQSVVDIQLSTVPTACINVFMQSPLYIVVFIDLVETIPSIHTVKMPLNIS